MKKTDLGATILPEFLRPAAKRFWRSIQRWKVHNISRQIYSKELIDGFHKLGIQKNQLIWVHSSLSSFGYVEGGAKTVISALKEAVGKNGTILMPSFSLNPDRSSLKQAVFDVKSTPSSSGKITDFFWRSEGTLRSVHPLRSVSGFGPLASQLLENHIDSKTEFGYDTPFGKFLRTDGYVVFLGVGIEKLNLYHAFEDTSDKFPYEVYSQERIPAKWFTENGTIKTKMVQVHNPAISMYRIEKPKGVKIRKEFLDEFRKMNAINENKIGSATCLFFHIRDFLKVSKSLLDRKITIYNIPPKNQEKFLR